MIRTLMFSAVLAALLSSVAPLPAQDDPSAPVLSDVMSPSDLRETGVASLTPSQRAALDAWLARYTAIIERAASRGAQAAHDAHSSGGGTPNESYAGPLAVPYGSRIAEVKDGGTYILLSDGTEWEVYLPNRPSTMTWGSGDYLIVAGRAVELNGQYFFQLVNGRDGSSAAVRWRGKR